MARVYVGIVTYNSLLDLPGCVAALRAQTYSDVHIMVLDNASRDASVAWVRSVGLSLIVNSENVGFARAHNRLLSQCPLTPEDFYMPLNPDVVLMPNYIAAVVSSMAAPSVGWATGKLLLTDQPDTLYSAGHGVRRDGYFFNIGYHEPDQSRFSTPCEVFGAPGAAPLISASLIRDVAPHGELFDAAMFMYGEDTDLDWRARRAGWHCWYVPQAVAYHRGSTPRAELKIQAVANRYLSVLKNAYMRDLLTYNVPIIALHTLFRLMVTPRLGLLLLRRLIHYGSQMWRQRTPPRITRKTFIAWCHTTPPHPAAAQLASTSGRLFRKMGSKRI